MVLLTWCANLQPAGGLEELERFLRGQAREVRRTLGRGASLGLGLWFPARLAAGLDASPGDLGSLREEFAREGFFLATTNAFPMGRFHGPGVKERVYFPSWAEEERKDYTIQVMKISAALARKGRILPVSTLPLGWPREGGGAEERTRRATKNLVEAAMAAEETSRAGGVDLVLSLEPEPGCLLETGEDFFSWFEGELLPAARAEGMEEVCRRRIGLCLDLCHEAVMGEDPGEVLEEAARRGLRVGKVQLSSALEVFPGEKGWRRALEGFDEPTYLHQVTWWDREGRRTRFFRDLAPALGEEGAGEAALWRVHFHLPLFWEGEGALGGTAPREIPPLLERADLLPEVLEIETYTWRVLPWVKGEAEVLEGVVREFTWVREAL